MKLIVSILFLFVASASASFGQLENQEEALRGIDSLEIDVNFAIPNIGISATESEIYGSYEARLKQNGIHIGRDHRRPAVLYLIVQGRPFTTIVNGTDDSNYAGYYRLTYQLSLLQVTGSDDMRPAITWFHSGRSDSAGETLDRELQEIAESVMDKFINDYRRVN